MLIEALLGTRTTTVPIYSMDMSVLILLHTPHTPPPIQTLCLYTFKNMHSFISRLTAIKSTVDLMNYAYEPGLPSSIPPLNFSPVS